MEFFSIASGSSGNCICVGNDRNHVMVDVGISGKRVDAGMASFDLKTSDMDGILITHEHSDHIAGLGVISRKYGLPIYSTRATIEAIKKAKPSILFLYQGLELKNYQIIQFLLLRVFLLSLWVSLLLMYLSLYQDGSVLEQD